jgi:hypothetical protein
LSCGGHDAGGDRGEGVGGALEGVWVAVGREHCCEWMRKHAAQRSVTRRGSWKLITVMPRGCERAMQRSSSRAASSQHFAKSSTDSGKIGNPGCPSTAPTRGYPYGSSGSASLPESGWGREALADAAEKSKLGMTSLGMKSRSTFLAMHPERLLKVPGRGNYNRAMALR